MNKKMFIPGCLAFLSLALAACGEQTSSTPEPSVPTPTHTHTWETEWESDGTNHWHACTDASCDEVNGKVAHSGGTATCQEKAKCEVCGAEYGELAGHNYSETWTCSAEGHYKECITEGCDAKTETTAHSGGTATCKAKGTCSECGEAYGEFAAHTWEEKVDADFLASKATCTTKATYYKSCAVCGETSDETFEGGDLLPHSGGTATCTAKAVCDVCEQPYGEFAAHKGGTADCQNKAVCEVCRQPYGELSTTHTWKENEFVNKTATGHSHPCSVAGCQEVSEQEAHKPGPAATEDAAQVCTDCGYIITPKLNHTTADPETAWSSNDTEHWHKCADCDDEAHYTNKGAHVEGTPATCVAKAVCSVCSLSYGKTLPHTYDLETIAVDSLPTPSTAGALKVSCENSECTSKVTLVLPVYNNDNYVTTLKTDATPIHYELSLTASAIETIVADDEIFNDAELTAKLNAMKQVLSPSQLGKDYIVTVNGQEVSYTAIADSNNHLTFEIELSGGQILNVYKGTQLIKNAPFTVSTAGTYMIYVNTQDELYPDLTEAVPYAAYTMVVSGQETPVVSTALEGYYGSFTAELTTGQFVTVYGDDQVLIKYYAISDDTYKLYVTKKNTVEVVSSTLFLNPGSDWKADNAKFAAYFFGTGDTWASMTDLDNDGIYEVKIPSGAWTHVIFVRINPSAATPSWDAKWGQTTDLLLPTSANVQYNIESPWGSDANEWKATGNWSVPHVHTYAEEYINDATHHWHKATCEHTSATSVKVAHTYNQKVTTLTGALASEATCTANATYYYSCVCGVLGTETFEVEETKLSHSFGTTWEYQEADGHAYKCTVCGANDTVVGHTSSGPATETTAETCTVCGYEINPISTHEHTYDGAAYTTTEEQHWIACTTCTSTEGYKNVGSHTWVEDTTVENTLKSAATCNAKAVYYKSCEVCGYVSTILTFEFGEFDLTKHVEADEYSSDETNHWYECTVCGQDLNVEAHEKVSDANFVNGDLCKCGYEMSEKIKTVTINYYNSEGWAKVNMYAWGANVNDAGMLAGWPGAQMTANATLGENWYSVTLENKDLSGLCIIFNNGSTQTGNITVNVGKYFYFGTTGKGYATQAEALAALEAESQKEKSTYHLAGGMNGWSTTATPFYKTSTANVVELEIDLEASSTAIEFKVVSGGTWYGAGSTIVDVTSSAITMSTSAGNCKIKATTGGTYIFSFNTSTKKLTVTKKA